MSNLHSSIVKTCFSLAKFNNGLFKSEKQGKFLSSLGITISSTQNHNLGYEYNFKTCGTTYWTIYLDAKGVNKITKENSKGLTVHFEREEGSAYQNKQDIKKAALEKYLPLYKMTEDKCHKISDREFELEDKAGETYYTDYVLKLIQSEAFKSLDEQTRIEKVEDLTDRIKRIMNLAKKNSIRLNCKYKFYSRISEQYRMLTYPIIK